MCYLCRPYLNTKNSCHNEYYYYKGLNLCSINSVNMKEDQKKDIGQILILSFKK